MPTSESSYLPQFDLMIFQFRQRLAKAEDVFCGEEGVMLGIKLSPFFDGCLIKLCNVLV